MHIDEIEELRCQLRQLSGRLAELEGGLASMDSPKSDADLPHPADEVLGRRQLLRRLGAVGAGAAGLAVIGGITHPAAAANGDAITVGGSFTGSTITRLSQTSGSAVNGGAFSVSDSSGALPDTSLLAPALTGYASGARFSTGAAFYGDTAGMAARGASYGAKIETAGVHLKLSNTSTINSPAGNAPANDGYILKDASGALWYSTGTSNTSWRNLAGPTTAGSLHLVTPSRVLSESTTLSNAQTALVTCSSVAPAGASAVLVSILAFATQSDGYYTAYAEGTASPGTINCYWKAGAQVASTTIVRVNGARQFRVRLTNAGGTAGAAVDILGYYL